HVPQHQPAQEKHQTEIEPAVMPSTCYDQHNPGDEHDHPAGQREGEIGHAHTPIGRRPGLRPTHCCQTLAPKRRHEQVAEQHDDGEYVHHSDQPSPAHSLSLVFRASARWRHVTRWSGAPRLLFSPRRPKQPLQFLESYSITSAMASTDAQPGKGARKETRMPTPNWREESVAVAGIDVHFYRGGEGPPLVLLHGGSGNPGWLQHHQALAEQWSVY